MRVHADFALRDDAVLVRVNELNRVFDGDDVAVAVGVAVANHGGERSGFARACAADKNHQAAFFHHHLFQDGRQVHVFKLGDFAGNHAADQGGGAALHHGVDAEARYADQADGEVAFVGGEKFFRLLVVHNRTGDLLRVFGGEGFVGNFGEFAVQFHGGRIAGGDE